jgi:hypothetical protein
MPQKIISKSYGSDMHLALNYGDVGISVYTEKCVCHGNPSWGYKMSLQDLDVSSRRMISSCNT